ncbi:hypothetical protein PTNB73_02370 [Pyrenophora teres f. teres]|nr:hypothetical protein HRS9139_00955 [Pyrenophora teres f. teres]KAE8868453.1 hypothetical protein PTNB29_02364 [Pyrenophora teres f. teres]KAE8873219.1 hypothetical protein PTNB73_02370 [Pyrenophora teres f. teres]
MQREMLREAATLARFLKVPEKALEPLSTSLPSAESLEASRRRRGRNYQAPGLDLEIPNWGRVFGNIIEGVGGVIGGAADLLTIGGAGRVIGNIGEVVGGVIGGAADLITIGGTIGGQPAQKRDGQRSRGRVIGNIGEVVGGVIGGAADLLTINEAVQGQGQPVEKREA